ncbi:MAG: hypothetical protein ACLUQ6_10755 [Alistipes onderdonkii]
MLKPLVQENSGDVAQIASRGKAQAFAHAADTVFWEVASYEDALAGIITRRDNPTEKQTVPLVTAEPYQQEGIAGWLSMRIDKPSVMVVAVDTEHRIYGYTQQEIAENFPKLYVSVVFKPWKEGTEYKDGNWIFRNQFYVPPTYLDCYIAPSVQARGGRRNDRAFETQGLCLCRRYDGVEDRLIHRRRGRSHHLEERPVANPFQPQFHCLERGVGRLRHGSEQPDADGGRGRPDQRGLRLFETGGRPRRRARDLPDCLPHMAPRIPLCRGRLARGQ